jgi:HlyD family secretion protein
VKILRLSLIFLTIGMAFAGCGKGVPKADAPAESEAATPVAVEMADAKVQAAEVTVSGQGTLAPAQGASVRLTAPVAGRITLITVHEGEPVHAGQLLARVDNRPQQAAARSAQAAVKIADVQARSAALAAQAAAADQTGAVQTAQLTLEAARQERAAQTALAQNALDAAQTDLTRTRAGARPQEIAQAEQVVAQADATRARAQTELTRQQFLVERGISARRQLEDATTALTVAASALTSAQQALSLLRAGARPEELRASQLRVDAARAALAQAAKSGDARVLQAQAALRQAQQSRLNVAAKQQDALAARGVTAQKEADLTAAQATAATADLAAPIDGIVTKRSANVGDTADPTLPFLEISNSTGLNLIANLPAEEGLKVRVGMSAHITSADLPGKTFAGRVLSVGQVDPQSNLMTIRLAVASPGSALRVGAFATAAIVLRRVDRAVVVPKTAVVTKEGKTVIFTVGADSIAHAHPVEVGPDTEGGTSVALLHGLNGDEKVVNTGSYELSEGAKVKPAEAPEGDAAEGKGEKGKAVKP